MFPISLQEIPHEILNALGAVGKISFPRQGHTSDVGIIDTEKGRVVLKRTKGTRYNEWLKRESFILKCLLQTNLRVPKVYQYVEREDKNQEMQSWLLMECLPGETLRRTLTHENDPSARYDILFQVGKSLRNLHMTPCPEELKIEETWLDRMFKQAERHLGHFEVDGSPALLESLKTARPAKIEQTLIHGDFTIDNVLVHEGSVSGMIDWSGAALGDPRYDVALAIRKKPHVFQTTLDYRAFFDGYGNRITKEEYEYFANGLYAFF